MTLQVLVATMNQSDYSLLDKMNIQSDVIVGNQCEQNRIATFTYNGNRVKWLSFAERGVGLNRNNTLIRANADICLFADDDVVYDDNYSHTIVKAFREKPDADIILFNLRKEGNVRGGYVIPKWKRVHWYNCLKYGICRASIKLAPVRREGLSFNQLFGGGTVYSCGEDSLFFYSALRHKLKIYACPEYIGKVYFGESSWFHGYNEKFLYDKGALFNALTKKLCFIFNFLFLTRHHEVYKDAHIGFWKAYALMALGGKNFHQMIHYEKMKQ